MVCSFRKQLHYGAKHEEISGLLAWLGLLMHVHEMDMSIMDYTRELSEYEQRL
jgi:hypothetical protein